MTTEALVQSCEAGDLAAVEAEVASGAPVNAHNKRGFTPLICAARQGSLDVVNRLLQASCDVNLTTPRLGLTPLTEATLHEHAEVARRLIDAGAEINLVTKESKLSPLLAAVWKCQVGLVELLVSKGAAVDHEDAKHVTALGVACTKDDTAIATVLLKAGAGVCHRFSRSTPLVAAAERGFIGCCRLLLEYKAEINQTTEEHGVTALVMAAQGGHYNVVRLLLDAGGDVHYSTPDKGATALVLSSRFGHTDVVNMLMENGANVNHAMHTAGITPLFAASEFGHPSTCEALLRNGAEVDGSAYSNNTTPLMMAAFCGHDGVVRVLLDGNADVNKLTHDTNRNALHLAANYGHSTICGMLLKEGGHPNVSMKGCGRTALHCAVQEGDEGCTRVLLDNGASTNVREQNGVTPLHLACWRGLEALVEMLVQHGADVNAEDRLGRLPLSLAGRRNEEFQRIRKILVDAGADRTKAFLRGGGLPVIGIGGGGSSSNRSRSEGPVSQSWREVSISGAAMRSKTPTATAGLKAPNMEERNFSSEFSDVAATDSLLDTFRCSLNNTLGRMYVTQHSVCFASSNDKVELDISNVADIARVKSSRWFDNSIRIRTTDGTELLFESFFYRDKVLALLMQLRKANIVIEEMEGMAHPWD